MLLAHRLWEQLAPGATATLDDWTGAHAAAHAELEAEFVAHWRGFAATEQKTMRALVAGDGSPYRAAVLERLQLSKPTAQNALRRLAASAEVESDGQRQVIVDPLFAEWIGRFETAEE
jgi:hypothetical protein